MFNSWEDNWKNKFSSKHIHFRETIYIILDQFNDIQKIKTWSKSWKKKILISIKTLENFIVSWFWKLAVSWAEAKWNNESLESSWKMTRCFWIANSTPAKDIKLWESFKRCSFSVLATTRSFYSDSSKTYSGVKIVGEIKTVSLYSRNTFFKVAYCTLSSCFRLKNNRRKCHPIKFTPTTRVEKVILDARIGSWVSWWHFKQYNKL